MTVTVSDTAELSLFSEAVPPVPVHPAKSTVAAVNISNTDIIAYFLIIRNHHKTRIENKDLGPDVIKIFYCV